VFAFPPNVRCRSAAWTVAAWTVAASVVVPDGSAVGQTSSPPPSPNLAAQQAAVAERYARLELLAGRLAELSRSTQPGRASVLRELLARSGRGDVTGKFRGALDALERESYSQAQENQTALHKELAQLLDLLLEEDRDRQLKSQRERAAEYLKDLKRVIRSQRGVAARTEGGDDQRQLAEEQRDLADETESLEDRVQEGEELRNGDAAQDGSGGRGSGSGAPPAPRENGDAAPPGQKRGSQQGPSGPQPSGDEPREAEPPSERDGPEDAGDRPPRSAEEGLPEAPTPNAPAPQSDSGPPPSPPSPPQNSPSAPGGKGADASEGSGDAPPGEAPGGEGASDSPMKKTAERLNRAQQRMQAARRQLEQSQRKDAEEAQREALRDLEQAEAELQRILRQLREEELERALVLLEARLRKMLEAQNDVHAETQRLAAAATAPEHELEIAGGRLARQERSIIQEADRALVLLREDGTSAAFPEALEQARDDMESIAARLADADLGPLTQGLEEDVIAALEEALGALEQALDDLREQRNRGESSGEGGDPGDAPLVDQLAELRMIRSLQVRVNRRTEEYGKLVQGEEADKPQLREALEGLARRQQRIFEATRDLQREPSP